MFSENSSFVRSYKRQLRDLVVIFNGSIWPRKDPRIGEIYVGIVSWFSNLQCLSLDGFQDDRFGQRLLTGLSSQRCSSSMITDLRIRIHNFDDCLCLIDGRLSQLHKLVVNLDFVRHSSINLNNQVKMRNICQ